MSVEEIKKLVAIVAQNQTQITSLIDLVKRHTLEHTPMYQKALDLQIAQQERETRVVQIAERFHQELELRDPAMAYCNSNSGVLYIAPPAPKVHSALRHSSTTGAMATTSRVITW